MRDRDIALADGNTRYRHLLDTEELRGSLRSRTVRGGLSSFLGENISFVLRTLSTILLARILLPEHFGVIGMVTAVTTFADRFKDLGLDIATIQKKTVTHEQVSTLFWINVGIGTALMVIVAALSPVLAWFYKDERLIAITLSISFNFFLNGITIQHQALLKRQMSFGKLAQIQVTSIALGLVAGLALAWLGFGYWALVASQLLTSLSIACGVFIACRWLPGRPTRGSGVGLMLRFGRDVTAFNLVYFFSRSLGQILLGRFWGAASLGLYNQAEKLIVLPIEQSRMPLNSVAISALSVVQADPPRYREICSKIIGVYAFVSIPIAAYLAIFSHSVVRLFLGHNWLAAAPIFRILALSTLVGICQFPCAFTMITNGRTKQFVTYGLAQALTSITAFIISVRWGAVGVSYGHLAASCLFLFPGLWLGLRKTPMNMATVFRAMLLPAAGTLLMAVASLAFARFVPSTGALFTVSCSFVLAVLVYLGFWVLVPGGRGTLLTYLSHLRHFVTRNRDE